MHPPRPLRTSYPPGSLPPASALDEITTQLLASTTSASISSSWKHSSKSTRSRLFTIARKESMSAVGGHKREISESMSIVPISKPVRPKLTVLGSSNMKRQQHGMDSLYADDEPESFSETLRYDYSQGWPSGADDVSRLSGTLQDTAAKDSDSILTSGGGLSSRMSPLINCRRVRIDIDRSPCIHLQLQRYHPQARFPIPIVVLPSAPFSAATLSILHVRGLPGRRLRPERDHSP